MSGRGKGGKGLGKGGAKRHRKVLRDNIQGVTKVCWIFLFDLSLSRENSTAVWQYINATTIYSISMSICSRLFAVWLVVVVWNASATWSTKRRVACWKSFWRTWFVTPSLILNTLVARPSHRWTSCTRSNARAARSTALVVKCFSWLFWKKKQQRTNLQKPKTKTKNTGSFNFHQNMLLLINVKMYCCSKCVSQIVSVLVISLTFVSSPAPRFKFFQLSFLSLISD